MQYTLGRARLLGVGIVLGIVLGVSAAIAIPFPRNAAPTTAPLVNTADSLNTLLARTNEGVDFLNINSLLSKGRQAYQAENYKEARQYWTQAIERARGLEQLGAEVQGLGWLALAELKLGRFEQAADALEQGEAIAASLTDGKSLRARLALGRGQLALAQGRGEAAVESFRAAELFYKSSGDLVGALGAALNQSQALQSVGAYRRSLRVLQNQRARLEKMAVDSPALAAQGQLLLGNNLRQLGQLEDALAALGRSQELADSSSEGALEEGLRDAISLSLGQTHLAIAYQARTSRDGTLTRSSKKQAIQWLGESVKGARSPDLKARATLALLEAEQFPRTVVNESDRQLYFRRWLALHPLVEEGPAGRRSVELSLQWVDYGLEHFRGTVLQQQLQEALVPTLQRLARQAERLEDLRSQSLVLGTLGELYEQAGQTGDAQTLWRRALMLGNGANAPEATYRWNWLLGRSLAQGDREEALFHYRQGFDSVQQLRKDLVGISETVQFSFRDSVEPVYRELTALLLQGSPSQGELGEARQVIEALQLARLDNFFRQACLDVEPEFLDQTIDRNLDAASVYSVVLDNSVASIVKRPGKDLQHFTTAIPKETLDDTLRQLDRSFQNPALPTQERLALSQQVYDWLLAPVVPTLEEANIDTLVMVLDGDLGNIPVAALYDGDSYVVEKFNLARSPSLQLLPPVAKTNQDLSVSAAGIATEAPSFSQEGLTELPFVGLELDAIGDRFPGKVLRDDKVTQTALRSEILRGRNNIIHIATHAQFSSNAERTFLLTWDQRIGVDELDGLLQPGDQQDAINLLVLSACETASGDPRATLGLTGIAIQAGARSVLGTLWQVSDASTAELMARFYDYLQDGLTKAEAISQAQRDLLNDPEFRHPFYWAPYTLVGNWR
ncbi:MAG: CHAT domain-containing protein [Cyanophyceae cyanobacterium]